MYYVIFSRVISSKTYSSDYILPPPSYGTRTYFRHVVSTINRY